MREISQIFSSLRKIVKKEFIESEDETELKIFPGLKLSAKKVPINDVSTLCTNGTIRNNFLLYLNGEFSKPFKDEIKNKIYK